MPLDSRPDLGRLRLVAGNCSSAMIDEEATVRWWCAPAPDSSPIFWQLLGPNGALAGWAGVVAGVPSASDDPAAAVVGTELTTTAGRFRVRDAIVGPAALVRSIEAVEHPLTVTLVVRLAPFDSVVDAWTDDGTSRVDGLGLRVTGADRIRVAGWELRAELDLMAGQPRELVIAVGPPPRGNLRDLVTARERAWDRVARRARVPQDHPKRAVDALRVLTACTFDPTGAVIAAPTTSIPEVPGGDRQWDYRYSWLRDASAAASVASRLGQPRVADRYLAFVCERTGLGDGEPHAVVTVEGKDLPEERTLDHELWWGGAPVRIGNGATDQVQVDALGFFGEAMWSHRRSGGRVTAEQRRIVRDMADRLVDPPGATNGIWEFRDDHDLVSAELGRWLLIDRAIRLDRLHRPWRRPPARWITARNEAAHRVRATIDRHGYTPLAFHGRLRGAADATGLLAVVFRLIDGDDPVAHRLVDATIEALGDGPFLRRYPASVDDGFAGTDGAFLPASWWAVSALATLGRIDEAEDRGDAMCKLLPALLPEEWDVANNRPLGNTPLVWSHVEAARAFHLLHAARIERRFGRVGLRAWRVWRYLVVRWLPT
jgi:hypothetical protein